jgi:hypothetical protein
MAYRIDQTQLRKSIEANEQRLKDIQTQAAIKGCLQKATQVRLLKHPPKMTMESYAAAYAGRPRSGKAIAHERNASLRSRVEAQVAPTFAALQASARADKVARRLQFEPRAWWGC